MPGIASPTIHSSWGGSPVASARGADRIGWWLRIAHVIASAPSDDCVKELVASMPDRARFAKGLAAAASFFHDWAELAIAAERQFLDACVAVGR